MNEFRRSETVILGKLSCRKKICHALAIVLGSFLNASTVHANDAAIATPGLGGGKSGISDAAIIPVPTPSVSSVPAVPSVPSTSTAVTPAAAAISGSAPTTENVKNAPVGSVSAPPGGGDAANAGSNASVTEPTARPVGTEIKGPKSATVNSGINSSIRAKLTLGRQQRTANKFKEAESTFKDAISLSRGGDRSVEAECTESLAGLYLATSRLDEAFDLYSKAIGILENAKNPELLGIAYDNMSRVCAELNKFDEAESYNKMALEILQKISSTPKIDIVKALNQQAMIEYARRKYPEAEIAYKKAMTILRSLGAVSDKSLMPTILDNLGGVYMKTGDYIRAESVRKEALAMFEKNGGSKSPDTAACLMNVAAVYGHQQKYEQALPYMKRAEEIDEAIFGLRNRTTLSILKNYIVVLKLAHHEQELQALTQRLKSSTPSR